MNATKILTAAAVLAAVMALCLAVPADSDATVDVDGLVLELGDDGTASIVDYTGSAPEVEIPGTVTVDGVDYTVTAIGNSAFSECETIKKVVIPATVTSVTYPFWGCSALEVIEVAEGNPSYSSVGGVLFSADGAQLISFPGGRTEAYVVPDGVTSIADAAFQMCSLESVVISDTVTSAGASAFIDCPNLASVTIGSGLVSIGNWAFNQCPSLESFMVSYANPNFDSVDGVLYTEGRGTLFKFPAARGGEFNVPEGVTSIGMYAFAYSPGLSSVTLPESVTSIGPAAFFHCSGLEEIHMEGVSAEGLAIGTLAFHLSDDERAAVCTVYGPVGLLDGLTDSSTTINYYDKAAGEALFGGISYTINGGEATVTWIDDGIEEVAIPSELPVDERIPVTAMDIRPSSEYNIDLVSLSLPSTMTAVEPGSLWQLHALEAVSVEEGNPELRAADGVLYDRSGERLLGYPAMRDGESFTVPDGVTSVAARAFAGSMNLKSIDLNGVTELGEYAMTSCYALESVTMHGVTEIPDYAFYASPSLSEVEGMDGVTTIGSAAFSMTGLTDFSLPDSVTQVGTGVFAECYMLASFQIGAGLSHIPNSMFRGCDSLVEVTGTDGVTSIGADAFRGCSALESIDISGATELGDRAFYGCRSMTEASVSNSLLTIGAEAFYGSGITAFTVPEAVETIGDGAFNHCMDLETFTFSSSMELVPDGFFDGCPSLARFDVAPGSDHLSAVDGVLYDGSGTFILLLPATVTAFTVPAGSTVSEGAFQYCSGITGIDVEEGNAHYSSVDGILFSADGTKLIRFPAARGEDYDVPEGVTNIAPGAFAGSYISSVSLGPGISEVGQGAFAGSNLMTVRLGCPDADFAEDAFCISSYGFSLSVYVDDPSYAGVLDGSLGIDPSQCNVVYTTEDGRTGFEYTVADDGLIVSGYSGGPRVVIPESVEFSGIAYQVVGIGGMAFSSNTKVVSVEIPGSVRTIGTYAFIGCSNLSQVVIGYGVEAIAEGAFSRSGLTSVEIPGSVTDIGIMAFWMCEGLESVHLGEGVEIVAQYAFYGCSSLTDLYIPASVMEIGDQAFYGCPVHDMVFLAHPDYVSQDSFGVDGERLAMSVYGARPAALNQWGIQGVEFTFLDTVGAPVPSVPAGEYDGSVTVSFSSELPWAVFRYTTDGSVPTEDSPVLDGDITMTRTTTITVAAFVDGLPAGEAASYTYVIDGVPSTPSWPWFPPEDDDDVPVPFPVPDQSTETDGDDGSSVAAVAAAVVVALILVVLAAALCRRR